MNPVTNRKQRKKEPMDQPPPTFTVTDMSLAATLVTEGTVLVCGKLAPPGSSRVAFEFRDGTRAQEIMAEFWAGLSKVEPRIYNGAFRRILDLVRDTLNAGGNV